MRMIAPPPAVGWCVKTTTSFVCDRRQIVGCQLVPQTNFSSVRKGGARVVKGLHHARLKKILLSRKKSQIKGGQNIGLEAPGQRWAPTGGAPNEVYSRKENLLEKIKPLGGMKPSPKNPPERR